MALVETLDYKDPSDFLDALSPRRARWSERYSDWLFRGQGDASWRLIASASRPAVLRTFGNPRSVPRPVQDLLEQLEREMELVRCFAREADRHGLSVPGFDAAYLDPESVLREISSIWAEETEARDAPRRFVFPSPNREATYGMAQHYGVPTRLLDWTEHGFVAAYFAASTALRALRDSPQSRRKRLAVWALDPPWFEGLAALEEENPSLDFPVRGLRVVRASWATNPNLRAQRGLFTVHDEILGSKKYSREVSAVSVLEELLFIKGDRSRLGKREAVKRAPTVLYKIRLPWSGAEELLRLLHLEGFDEASLFPGYEGVVARMRQWVGR